MPLDASRIAELEDFFLELNRATADVILPLFRGALGVEDKGGKRGFDPVTAADKGAEAAIRKLVGERFPEHGVLGEEYGADRVDADFVWVLDPIDGTRAFVAGLPVWTTLIGLRHEGRPVMGTIGQPFLGEVYLGSPAGSRLVSARGASTSSLRVRPCSSLSDAVIASTDPDTYFEGEEMHAWRALRRDTRLARLGCDAYSYAMVAAGTIDLVVESGLQPWDIEAAIPVVENAGGVFTDWRGGRVGTSGGQIAIAGDRRCLEAALVHLAPCAKG